MGFPYRIVYTVLVDSVPYRIVYTVLVDSVPYRIVYSVLVDSVGHTRDVYNGDVLLGSRSVRSPVF